MRTILILSFCMCLSHGTFSQLNSFAWLVGDWTMTTKKGDQRMEMWRKTEKNLFTGKGVKIAAGDTTLLESLKLSYHDDHVWYIPTVPDQNNAEPVPFKMVQSAGNKIVFENPEHDFPQRILYQYIPSIKKTNDADSMYVRVESLEGKGIDYWFRRY